MRKLVGILVLCAAAAPALAQPAAKDGKDFRIEMLAAQRNEAADRLTLCYSENSVAIANLQAENSRLKAQLADAQKKAERPPAPPAAPASHPD